jgi:hypothetical protein
MADKADSNYNVPLTISGLTFFDMRMFKYHVTKAGGNAVVRHVDPFDHTEWHVQVIACLAAFYFLAREGNVWPNLPQTDVDEVFASHQ